MNPKELWEMIWPIIFSGYKTIRLWYRTHRRWVWSALVCGAVIFCGLVWYQAHYHKTIVILTGPRGSSSWRCSKRIADRLADTQRIPGINYTVRTRDTNGSRDVDEQIRGDRDGQLIGFTDNGSDHPGELRTLLPLDFDYLHVLCRRKFLEELFASTTTSASWNRVRAGDITSLNMSEGETPAKYPLTLGAVLGKRRNPRVFAGPQGSGCRYLAEKVYLRYGKEPHELEQDINPALSNWEQARAALSTGNVDIVFYLGPLGATTVEEIAIKDHSAVLLGLNEIQNALINHEGFSLLPETFPENSYCDASAESSGYKLGFCTSEKLKTVVLRRLLVCSSTMQSNDAYIISQTVQKALGSDSRQIGLWPESNSKNASEILRIPAYPNVQTPPIDWWNPATWTPWWTSTIATIGLLGLGQFVTALRARPAVAEAKPANAPIAPRSPFDEQLAELEKWLAELEQSGVMDGQKKREYDRSLVQFRNRIRKLRRQNEITDKEFHTLFQALRNIRAELDLEKPVPAGKKLAKNVG